MILFLTKADPQLERLDPEHRLGRLITPRHTSSVERTAVSGRPWAGDNDCFQALDADAYLSMCDRLVGLPGCRFVTAPDRVGDAPETLALLETWRPQLEQRRLPIALVAQDGLTPRDVDWSGISALFIGGSSEWKMGKAAERVAIAAREHGKWLHMGRVNSTQRATYARSIGCDSIDGTMVARFTDRYLQRGLSWTRLHEQLRVA